MRQQTRDRPSMDGAKRYLVVGSMSEPAVRRMARGVDVACMSLSAVVVAICSDGTIPWNIAAGSVLASSVLAVLLLQLAGAYRLSALADMGKGLLGVGYASLLATVVPIGAIHLFGGSTALGQSMAWLLVGCNLAFLAISRVLLGWTLRRWQTTGRLREHIAIVGSNVAARHVLWHLHRTACRSFEIVGIYGHRPEAARRLCLGYETRGQLETLIVDARRRRIDTVIVALPADDGLVLGDLLAKLRALDGEVRIGLAIVDPRSGTGAAGCGVDLVVPLEPRHELVGWRSLAKIVEDRMLACVILILASPLLLAIALTIRLDSPGPILFRQKRYGLNNRLIDVFKFRTMHYAQTDADGAKLTVLNDPRITRTGAFLRRNSLDELPQFLNVLRGDMSIVGPRPHAVSAKAGALLYHEAVRTYDARHRVKPGITGWAQVNGWRGETNTVEQLRKRVEHDLYYIANWSVGLDLRIILRTALGGFRSRNAY